LVQYTIVQPTSYLANKEKIEKEEEEEKKIESG